MKSKFLPLLVIALAGTGLAVFHNCSPVSIKHQSFPEIGKKITVEPVRAGQSVKAESEYRHKLVYFIISGRNLRYDEDAQILMYSAESEDAMYTFTPQELREMHNQTKCPDYVSLHLENAFEGEGLFCNDSLDLTKINRVVVRAPGKEDKVATSSIREYALDNISLLALSYTVY